MARQFNQARAAVFFCGAAALALSPVLANHSWTNSAGEAYHWSHASVPVRLEVRANVSEAWRPIVAGAAADWDKPYDTLKSLYPDKDEAYWASLNIIDPVVTAGAPSGKTCKPTAGRINVCNSAYGYNGWLGIAQIWLSGVHITQGVTKLNDSYFRLSTYNSLSWKSLVACQEIGHDFGLGHQDENSSTDATNSCMDYTNAPAGNERPDLHDYEQLRTIYTAHFDSNFTMKSPGQSSGAPVPSEADGGDSPASWGRAIHFTADGRPDVFVRELAPGKRMLTHVFWAARNVRPQ